MHLQLGGPGAKVMSSSAATSISLSSHKTAGTSVLFLATSCLLYADTVPLKALCHDISTVSGDCY